MTRLEIAAHIVGHLYVMDTEWPTRRVCETALEVAEILIAVDKEMDAGSGEVEE